ncbi:MAG: EAL domain-containing protein, partial [Candidatus Hydrogenedentota bacterium]
NGFFHTESKKSGYIDSLSLWIYESALRDYALLLKEGYNLPQISINLSAREFTRLNLTKNLVRFGEKFNISPSRITLEITETSVFSNPVVANRILQDLRDAGFRLAIDDFGAGYAGISYFKEIPFDIIKIDKSLVKDLQEKGEDSIMPIFESLKLLANRKKLEIVVEGIERKSELEVLSKLGFTMFQGYYFFRPMRLADLREELKK